MGKVKVLVTQSCPTLCDPVDCAARQGPLSTESSRQKYWSGLRFPSPGDLPNPGIEPSFSTLQADSLLTEPPGKPFWDGAAFRKEPDQPKSQTPRHFPAGATFRQEVTSGPPPTPDSASLSPLMPGKQSPAACRPGGIRTESSLRRREGSNSPPAHQDSGDPPSLTKSSWGAVLLSSPFPFGASSAMGHHGVCTSTL